MTPGELPLAVLERARELGFLGPGPVEAQRLHAEGFGDAVEDALESAPTSCADLGTGGGVPGLVLAARWPGCRVTLIESARRRSEFLREVVAELGWEGRVDILEERAETAGRSPAYRETFAAVTARSLAEPAVTGEIAGGLVRVGGVLVVSEPPEPAAGAECWPAAELDALGFAPARLFAGPAGHFVQIRKERATPDDVPRGVGRAGKRPRW